MSMRHILLHAIPVLLIAVPSHHVSAQTLHVLSGTAYDSVGRVPLAGAVVQAIRLDSAGHVTSRAWSATSDATGHYAIPGLPAGAFAVGFQHDALAVLGIESPLRIATMPENADVSLDLAIPPASIVQAHVCSNAQAGAVASLLVGYVRAPASTGPTDTTSLQVRWTEAAIDDGRLRSVPRSASLTVQDDGRFAACGMPTATPLSVTITRAGAGRLTQEVTIPDGGVLRHEFVLPALSSEQGTATIDGRVLDDKGAPVTTGRAVIGQLNVDVPVSDGRFTMSSLPAGSWTVSARAIGYAPAEATVVLTAHSHVQPTITLGKRVQTLDEVQVVAKSHDDTRGLDEIRDLRKLGIGTIFLAGDPALATAHILRDIVPLAHGFTVDGKDNILARFQGRKRCSPTIYVDGIRSAELVPIEQVLGVAMYPDMTGVPVQYRDLRNCAVILIWVKH
jgi:hypothetical protein